MPESPIPSATLEAQVRKLPLSRYTVIDLTAHRAGPTCARQLADWGADVIKIEAPSAINKDKGGVTGERNNFDFQNLHRNKRSLSLNLKDPKGKEVFFRLVAKADVVIENFRSEVKHRLGIDYEACCKVNPRIVYGSIAGFGQDGPYGKRPGVDQIAQGMGGLMSITGLPGQGPVRVGIPICDLTAGHFLFQAILMALLERETSGEGQWVHTSLLESIIAMLDFQGARWLMAHEVPKQAGNNHPTSIPTGVFKTADGHINIAASGAVLFERFCKTAGLGDLLTDPRFGGFEARSKNREALNVAIQAMVQTRSSADWVRMLNEAGVPCGPINSIDQVFNDPQVQHLQMARPMHSPEAGDTQVVGQPINMSRTPEPDAVRIPTAELGEHTDDVLRQFGYEAGEIAGLRAAGIV